MWNAFKFLQTKQQENGFVLMQPEQPFCSKAKKIT